MPRHLESWEQRQFVQRVRLDPRTRDLPCGAVPNGGKRGVIEAKILKAEGVSPGIPDWLCFVAERGAWANRFVGLALEFKSPTGRGRLTDAQKQWHKMLRANNWRVEVVTNHDEAFTILLHHLGYTP